MAFLSMSSLVQFLSPRKPSDKVCQRTISADELRIAYTQQEIAEEQWKIRVKLNGDIARDLRNGAVLDAGYDFDPEAERVTRKNRRDP